MGPGFRRDDTVGQSRSWRVLLPLGGREQGWWGMPLQDPPEPADEAQAGVSVRAVRPERLTVSFASPLSSA